jgi:hypothetical protein
MTATRKPRGKALLMGLPWVGEDAHPTSDVRAVPAAKEKQLLAKAFSATT